MINLTKSIERTLERIEQTIERDFKNGVIYPAYSANNHSRYNATKAQLDYFRNFKRSLESGTNELMHCYDSEREKAMLEIIDAIWDFYRPFTEEQILNIEKDAFIEIEVKFRLKKFLQANPNDKDANCLKNFFNNPCASSWGQEDSYCGMRDFKYVESMYDFNKILREQNIEEITKSEGNNQIHIAFFKISECEVLKEKGLQYDYRRFLYKYEGSYTKEYKLWFDIREKGIYYVYIPEVII